MPLIGFSLYKVNALFFFPTVGFIYRFTSGHLGKTVLSFTISESSAVPSRLHPCLGYARRRMYFSPLGLVALSSCWFQMTNSTNWK